MIETPDEVVSLIQQAMKQLKLKEEANVELKKFYHYQFKQSGRAKVKVQETTPRWYVKFFYPIGQNNPPKTFTFRIEKGKYETAEELTGFIARMIQRYTSK